MTVAASRHQFSLARLLEITAFVAVQCALCRLLGAKALILVPAVAMFAFRRNVIAVLLSSLTQNALLAAIAFAAAVFSVVEMSLLQIIWIPTVALCIANMWALYHRGWPSKELLWFNWFAGFAMSVGTLLLARPEILELAIVVFMTIWGYVGTNLLAFAAIREETLQKRRARREGDGSNEQEILAPGALDREQDARSPS